MSEFIKIKPVGDTLTGFNFFIQSFGPNDKATISSSGESFTGYIDDVCIYDGKLLTADEVKRNYNAGKRSHK